MSELLNRFEIFSKISEKVKQRIKIFHVFDDYKGYNVLFITCDDNVFTSDGKGGNGTDSAFSEIQVITELCHKSIEQFFIGWSFKLALSSDQQLYGWGYNDWGQLGRGSTKTTCLRPEIIHFPSNESVVQVSCGSAHSLALTSEGKVYGWGINHWGQVGCGEAEGTRVLKPIRLEIFDKLPVKAIHCSYHTSFALTSDGLVYSWGHNEWCDLGHDLQKNDNVFEPKSVNLNGVISLCPGRTTHFLTNDGAIYFCGEYSGKSYQRTPKLINSEKVFNELKFVPRNQREVSIGCAVSGDKIYGLIGDSIIELNYKTTFDYYCDEYKVCYKTISVNNQIPSPRNTFSKVHQKPSSNKLRPENLIKSPRLKFRDFKILNELGSGEFGTVFVTENINNKNKYAIKMIKSEFKEFTKEEKNNLLREVKTLFKCDDIYVVHCFDHWIEDNNCLYIRMEFCSHNLQNIIQQKSEYFFKERIGVISIKEYFISCQLFQELLECVKYLHESNPPIIHRDLKPENILINKKHNNGRYLKLGDFGFAKFAYFTTKSDNSLLYLAPEVNSGGEHTIKSDIYSLGLIAKKIFDFDISCSDIKSHKKLQNKWKGFETIVSSMTQSTNVEERPTCAQLLNSTHWSVKKSDMDKLNLDHLKPIGNNNENFFDDYFETRLLVLKVRKGKTFRSKVKKVFGGLEFNDTIRTNDTNLYTKIGSNMGTNFGQICAQLLSTNRSVHKRGANELSINMRAPS